METEEARLKRVITILQLYIKGIKPGKIGEKVFRSRAFVYKVIGKVRKIRL